MIHRKLFAVFFFFITVICCSTPKPFKKSIEFSSSPEDSSGIFTTDIESDAQSDGSTEIEADTDTDTGIHADAGELLDTDTDTETVIGAPDFVCDGHGPENGCSTPNGCAFVDLWVCYVGDPVPILAINYQFGWTICSVRECQNSDNDCFLVSDTIGLSCHD